jgi:hypothetical protein
MRNLLLRIIKAVVRKWLPGFHIARNAPKGIKRKRVDKTFTLTPAGEAVADALKKEKE